MKKKKGTAFPRPVLKNLADDIKKLVDSHEGLLFVLEIIEELPYELRGDLFEGLSAFCCQEMVTFFKLLGREYGKDAEAPVGHALHKFALAGLDVDYFPELKGEFYNAYVSTTRHTGRVNLDIGWKTGRYHMRVESFSLSFNADGLNSFIIVEDILIKDFDHDHKVMADVTTVNYEECHSLINDAYSFNQRHMTRPALGRFIYNRYLEEANNTANNAMSALIRKVCPDLSPRQVVNSFFYALKQQDTSFLVALLDEQYFTQGDLFFGFNTALSPGAFLIEAGIDQVSGSKRRLEVMAHAIFVNDRDVLKNRYRFILGPDRDGLWAVKDIDRIESQPISPDAADNPFNIVVFCRVYEVLDMDELFETLDLLDNVHEVEEIPYGLHVRIGQNQDPSMGMSFLNGVTADLILNGDEFVVISPNESVVEEYHEEILGSHQHILAPNGSYRLNMSHAYSYLTGQFAAFEDLARTEAGEIFLEEGLRFISARYLVKDRSLVAVWLKAQTWHHYPLDDTTALYYRLSDAKELQFEAEYLLGSNWMTVSAFGERDLALARKQFEGQLNECLEFQGLELRENGMLAVLSPETKKRYPGLDRLIKGLYLGKWYDSRNPSLKGLSPSEASKTEEGNRLLWAMFKKMRELEKRKMMNRHNYRISLNEYIRKVEEKNRSESGSSS